MKNLLLLLVCFVLSFQVSFAQGESPTPTTIETPSKFEPTEKEKSLLWKITGQGLTVPSYLYGTIHMIGKDDFFLTESTKAAFKTAEKVTFEINMEKMNDISVLFSLMSKVMMNNGTTLKDLLSDEDYLLVNSHFKDLGLPMFMLEKIKPMFLSILASGDMGGGIQTGEIKSYEMEFMNMAKASEKTLDGLETIEFQMSVFDSIPYKDQANMLVDAIKSGDGGGDDDFKKMVEIYKKQDILAMQTMFQEDTEGVGKFEDIFLKNRNENWIPIIKKMASEQPTFIAVGAGHLGGKNGVIALMRAAGYTMTPIFETEPRP